MKEGNLTSLVGVYLDGDQNKMIVPYVSIEPQKTFQDEPLDPV